MRLLWKNGFINMLRAMKNGVRAFTGRRAVQKTQIREPEAVNAHPRPMRGFFSTLTPEQKKAVLEYAGEEGFGDSKLKCTQD
jgi:hypothetical protein